MDKKYFIINKEPNVNILGLDPIIRAFCSADFEELTGVPLSEFYYELENECFVAILEKDALLDMSNKLFEKMVDDHNFPKLLESLLMESGTEIYKLCKQTLEELKNGSIAEEEMKLRIIEIYRLFTEMCVPNVVAPMIEMGAGGMTAKIKQIIEGKDLDANNFSVSDCIAILTTPTKTIWTDEARKALHVIAQKKFEGNNIEDDLMKYVEDYGWVYYGYCGPKYGMKNAKDELIVILDNTLSPIEQWNKRELEIERTKKRQVDIMKALKFSDDEKYFMQTAQSFGYTKGYRANLMALADYTNNEMLSLFAKKEGYAMKQMGVCAVREIEDYLSGKEKLPDVNILNKRLEYCLLIHKRDSSEVLLGDEALKWVDDNVEIDKMDQGVSELSGNVACAGDTKIIAGTVKILLDPKEISKVESGDILLSTNTIPEHVPAMRRSSAIVTQMGGLTCHAAIVSRELNKPCLIGVKYLLDLFVDGDQAEIDLDRGVIRKI